MYATAGTTLVVKDLLACHETCWHFNSASKVCAQGPQQFLQFDTHWACPAAAKLCPKALRWLSQLPVNLQASYDIICDHKAP